VAGLDDHDLNEHLCLDAGRRAGLRVVRTSIVPFADETAVVVTRYDRRVGAAGILRVHQEDLCQALGVLPARKYQNDGGPGPATIAQLFRQAMRPAAAQETVWRFADALIWNWLIAGTDAHAKNYSLLLSGGEIRLAPLYDIASALPYGTHEKKLRLAMRIGSDYGVSPEWNRWPAAARDLSLDADELLARVRHLATVAPDAFSDAARSSEIGALRRQLPRRLLDLVSDRVARCRRLIESGGERA
jgi:serine/threonine-protein kinase HipA